MAILAYSIFGLWFLSEIVVNRIYRSPESKHESHDKGSLHFTWISAFLGNGFAIVSTIWFPIPVLNGPLLVYIGLGLIVLGMIIRFIAISSLGKFFNVAVTIHSDHVLKTDGIYHYLRHPSYLGLLLEFMGFGISLNNWISLASVALFMLPVMFYRIHIEEQALIEHFGASYSDYMIRTKRILPWLY